MKVTMYAWLIAAAMIIGVSQISAQAPNPAPDLTEMSLEELMNTKVTSVSKKEEKLFQTAAAIYVITREDIRRSGLTNVPELLRLAPGLEVARIDGNKWAISSRGFNGRFANKLLVLIDGRSVYSPQFSGVHWEAQNLPLEEIERIEIIRGPGGTLWGANAVNGVINIITKPAAETQGGLMTAGGGSEEQGFSSIRYGGKIGAGASYRAYAKYFNRSGLVNASGRNVHDWQNAVSGGWRLDWKKSERDALTWQGDIDDSSVRETSIARSLSAPFAPPTNTPGEFTSGNVLSRWNHIFSERSDTALQIYFDRSRREINDLGERVDTFDLDFQHHFAINQRQDLVWGLGYRRISDRTNGNSGTPVRYIPKSQTIQIFSAFAQDELTLIKNRLRLTVGAKLEHHDYTGFETQPSIRVLWTPNPHQTIWGAISRAVRIPTRFNEGSRINIAAFPDPAALPNVITIFGNPKIKSEELRAYELGYRVQPSRQFSLDLATFWNFYDRLMLFKPTLPFFEIDPQPHLIIPLRFDNLLRGETYGLEASANWNLTSHWQVCGNYSFLRIHLRRYPGNSDTLLETSEGENPRHQFQIRSYFRLAHNLTLNTALYRISQLPVVRIPGYTRLDLNLGWKVRESLDLSLGLQNLLDDQHPEFASNVIGVIPSQVKRSVYGKATWRF